MFQNFFLSNSYFLIFSDTRLHKRSVIRYFHNVDSFKTPVFTSSIISYFSLNDKSGIFVFFRHFSIHNNLTREKPSKRACARQSKHWQCRTARARSVLTLLLDSLTRLARLQRLPLSLQAPPRRTPPTEPLNGALLYGRSSVY